MNLLKNFIEEKQKLPLLNYMNQAMKLPAFQKYAQNSRKARIMNIVKRQPEVISVVSGVARDVLGKYHFEPVNSKSTGRNKILAALDFAQKVKYNHTKLNELMDILITGEGFKWLGVLSEDQQKELMKIMPLQFKEALGDEDFTGPRKLRLIGSTTMSTKFDNHDVTGYVQTVGGTKIPFSTKEIIKTSFMELDGKVEGFTPLFSLPLQLELLWLLWQNQYYKQARGNYPDMIVAAEGIDVNHPNYKKIKQELGSYNKPGSPTHGMLLLAGNNMKYNFQVLDKDDSLQFKEVGMVVQTLIAQMWQYPLARLGIKTDQASSSNDSNGMADRGYWLNVEQMQDSIDVIDNSQLWIPHFGVKLVHDKTYLHDEVVEGTAEQLRLTNLKAKQESLKMIGKSLTESAILNIINNRHELIDEEDVEEAQDDFMMEGFNGRPSDQALKNPGSSNSAGKRDSELQREQNLGKPSGV